MKNKIFIIEIHPKEDLDSFWVELEKKGCLLLYSESDRQSQKIYGHLPIKITQQDLMKNFPQILSIEKSILQAIDWESQWANHAQGYREGFLYVNIETKSHILSRGNQIKLKPGPGFGDLSHPTTNLLLKLMPINVLNQAVIDVGCGSGILSLASVIMGASSVIGIDIDKEALKHSCLNRSLNQMDEAILFMTPKELCKRIKNSKEEKNYLCLMNMIQSEQKVAWKSLSSVAKKFNKVITSGILTADRDEYLKICLSFGLNLIDEIQELEWSAFIFNRDNQ